MAACILTVSNFGNNLSQLLYETQANVTETNTRNKPNNTYKNYKLIQNYT